MVTRKAKTSLGLISKTTSLRLHCFFHFFFKFISRISFFSVIHVSVDMIKI